MKKNFLISSLCVFVLMLSACSSNPGKVNNATIILGTSTQFSEEELQQASDCVLAKFKSFNGCDLQKLWYDEQISSGMYGSNNILEIVLLSDFHVDASGADGGLNPNSDYKNWQWILKRDSSTSKWVLQDWGLG